MEDYDKFFYKETKRQRYKEKPFVPSVPLLFCIILFLAGCTSPTHLTILPTVAATAVAILPEQPQPLNALLPVTYTPVSHAPGAQPPVATPSPPAIAPTAAIGPSPTYYPYAGLTIDDLRERPFGGGVLQSHDLLTTGPHFSRHLISYPSDGLTIYGFMNTPPGDNLLPVALVLHGYVEPEAYAVEAYTLPYADELAKDGFLVIHPNYRNYPPSDAGDNLFRIGYAIDVLNLIAIIKQQAGQPGPLQHADPNRIFLFGHSMGGGIALRVLTVSQDVRGAALYAAMSGDEQRNFEKIIVWSNGGSGRAELQASAVDLARISPSYHLENINAPVSIHQGTADGVTPPEWSYQLCEALRALDKPVTCYRYVGEAHNFSAAGRKLLLDRVAAFFNEAP